MFKPNPILSCDFYKVGHVFQYPQGTEYIYSNFTARNGKHFENQNKVKPEGVVFWKLQAFLQELNDNFDENFFGRPKYEVVAEYKRRTDGALGTGSVTNEHIAALHDLGYLPLQIKALPEGSLVPFGVPMLTIENTLPEFYWLTNYVETMMSAELWKGITIATIAREYRKLLEQYATKTGSPMEFVDWQGHDFSMRGLSGVADSANAAGHLLYFTGTDTIPAIEYLEKHYYPHVFIGGSVPATEHSVMCAGGKDDERETIRHIIQDVYPSGVVSVVSDTWNFWDTITVHAAALKDVILNRQPDAIGLAKTVFRPDSGNPADIICGNPNALQGSPEQKGALECLWEIFGGTISSTGHKILNQRVGLIYGDSITLPLAKEILERMHAKGFASCNIVFGIGSYTYQFVTRDTLGFAMKATWAQVNGEERLLFKDPVTDSGVKKSARGRMIVIDSVFGDYILEDGKTIAEQNRDIEFDSLQTVYLDGKLYNQTSLHKIRELCKENL